MPDGPLSVPGAKATLVLAVIMTMLGFFGVASGYVQLTARPGAAVQADTPPQLAEAQQQLEDQMEATPLPRAVAIANLLVSALLLVSSFLLTARRPSALWWTTQALVANVVYTLGSAVAQVYLIWRFRPGLIAVAEAAIEAQPSEAGGPSAADVAGVFPWLLSGVVLVVSLILLLVYVILWRVSRRPSVQAFVRRAL